MIFIDSVEGAVEYIYHSSIMNVFVAGLIFGFVIDCWFTLVLYLSLFKMPFTFGKKAVVKRKRRLEEELRIVNKQLEEVGFNDEDGNDA